MTHARLRTAGGVVSTLLACLLMASCATAPRASVVPGLGGGASELTTAEADAWLDGFVPAALEREGIVGATVSIVADGEIVTERGWGWSDLGDERADRRPVDPDRTLFRIGSISKVVTATVVMSLVEEGVLDLDDPVQDRIDVTLPRAFDRPVTLRHLLSHTAGFEDKLTGVIAGPGEGPTTLRDAVAVDPPEQIYEPGTTPAYSNWSNGVAAYVAEQATGRPWADLVQERVFDPAGMTTATLDQPLSSGDAAVVSGGWDAAGAAAVPFEIVSPAPAGAVSATASDMSAFMLAQLGHADGMLGPETLSEMHAPALDGYDLGGLAAGPRMTLGLFEEDRNGHRVLGHGGDLTAFHAQMDLWPDDDAGIYVSLNSTGARGDATTAVREALVDGFADRWFPSDAAGEAAVTATETAGEHADALVGSYQVSRRAESTFVRLFYALSAVDISRGPGDSVLISAVTDTSGAPVELVEVEPWVWQEIDGDRRVAVDQVDGAVQAVGLNPAFTLQPMPAPRQVLPLVLVASLAVLVLALVGTIVRAVRRIWSGRRLKGSVESRAETIGRVGVAVALLALVVAGVLWATVASALLSDAGPPSAVVLRTAQVLTAVTVAGVLPAVVVLVGRVRRAPAERAAGGGAPPRLRKGVAVAGRALLVLGFTGLGYAAVTGGLVLPDISY
ncbi:serine hydrolase domain-containing protein [uncultured Frigoribacterium sp.]|uniref:serine hydrolase domain-containing protein n=1 Tax=uncultured Frigoribacterium sp. TaxID=335377 RepID=UPI0028D140C2|nr:serine hydrolase domain-containing protein [uncultured Frigoribacterium sp.]